MSGANPLVPGSPDIDVKSSLTIIEDLKAGTLTVNAFDYNYLGILTGKIVSIDKNFTMVENQPVFKVRCSFDAKQLHLKNGFRGHIKKG